MSFYNRSYKNRLLDSVEYVLADPRAGERYAMSRGALALAIRHGLNSKATEHLLGPERVNFLVERILSSAEELSESAKNPGINIAAPPVKIDPEPS